LRYQIELLKIIPTPIPFLVNHLFLFIIKEKSTGAILFIGKIFAPKIV